MKKWTPGEPVNERRTKVRKQQKRQRREEADQLSEMNGGVVIEIPQVIVLCLLD
jgi:hypothetical protein